MGLLSWLLKTGMPSFDDSGGLVRVQLGANELASRGGGNGVVMESGPTISIVDKCCPEVGKEGV